MNLTDIWGVKQVANATGLGRRTIHTLKSYGRLPSPDLIRSGRPLWKRSTIRGWCEGRVSDVNGRRTARSFNETYEAGVADDE